MAVMTADRVAAREGMYLTFKLGNEEYGLDILKIREIDGMMDVTRVPRTPDFVRGVVNLRGRVIPVVDLRRRFGLDESPDTDKTCIMVVQLSRGDHGMPMGIIVDEVCEVLDLTADQISGTPEVGVSCESDFITGLAKLSERVIILLDIDAVLPEGHIEAVSRLAD